METSLPHGDGSVKSWLQTVSGLETWEKNLRLGDAYLNTTAKSEVARARFTLGLLCLHNFMYDHAIEFFKRAQSDEILFSGRHYPMAMWGAAMATKQMLWQFSNCTKGKYYLQNITKHSGWTSELEDLFIDTGFALYPENIECKDDKEYQREKRFMNAAKEVMNRFPEEVEAKLFYGVSKAATLSHSECDDDGKSRKNKCKNGLDEVRNLLQGIYKKYPTHSGVLHYMIHIFDTPDVFVEGNKKFIYDMIAPEEQKDHEASPAIKAAHDYLKVATSSCHGLHMSSHIFMRLGSWKMSLTSNMLSIKVRYSNLVIFSVKIKRMNLLTV
jgi:hypothetical protein